MVTIRHQPGRVVIIGYGAIGRAALPALLDRLRVPLERVTIIDRVDRRRGLRTFLQRGLRFERHTITAANHVAVLGPRLGQGDLLIDLAAFIDTLDLLAFCQERGVLFLNTSVERWTTGAKRTYRSDDELLYPRLWRVTDWLRRHPRPDGPTAVIDHGANPGLVSHFVKAGLEGIAAAVLERRNKSRDGRTVVREALDARAWGRLAQALDVRVIQVSEIDTQATTLRRPRSEFQSTWSPRTMREEALTLSELCWGSHEGPPPEGALTFDYGPAHMVCLPTPAVETWVASWTPGGPFPGMLIGHDETYTIGEHLTVVENGRVRFRPTVYFAYLPCRPTLESLRECAAPGGTLQKRTRVLAEEIASGRDQLGCLLLGHPLQSWWIGSLLSVEEARRLLGSEVNATTVQVSGALVAGLEWMLEHPSSGPRLPDTIPHDEILPAARGYLGPFLSERGDPDALATSADGTNAWRFHRFRLRTSLSVVSEGFSHGSPGQRPRSPLAPTEAGDLPRLSV